MINFVVRDEKRSIAIQKLRKIVVMWTTLIFGIYVVAMSGFLGWKVFWSSKEKKASQEEIQLRTEITQLSENEVLAMRLADRGAEINKFVLERGDVTDQARQIPSEDYVVFGWEFLSTKDDVVKVLGQNPIHLKGYEDYLRGLYDTVRVEGLSYDPESGWMLTLAVNGWKKI